MFWMDGSSDKGDGSTAGMEMRGSEGGSADWYVKIGEGEFSVLGGDQQRSAFVEIPRDRGRWMQIVVYMQAESAEGSRDGVFRTWRRWAGECSFRLTHDLQYQPIRVPQEGPQGFASGYLLGWANAKYEEDTEFIIDNLQLSDESLLREEDCPPAAPDSLSIR